MNENWFLQGFNSKYNLFDILNEFIYGLDYILMYAVDRKILFNYVKLVNAKFRISLNFIFLQRTATIDKAMWIGEVMRS